MRLRGFRGGGVDNYRQRPPEVVDGVGVRSFGFVVVAECKGCEAGSKSGHAFGVALLGHESTVFGFTLPS